ncbi:unnamed protein product [Caenorhabditis brenneri]
MKGKNLQKILEIRFVEILRQLQEHNGEDEEKKDTDENQKLATHFLNGTKTSEEDFLAAARPLGTKVLGTSSTDLRPMTRSSPNTCEPCQEQELYKKARKAVRASEIHSKNLKKMEEALKKKPRDENTLEKELSHVRMRQVLNDKKEAAEVRDGEEIRDAVSARMDGFVCLFWNDQRKIRTWMEVKANGKVELRCKDDGENAFKTDLLAGSGGERRIIQLAHSFSILAQFNVPLAIVDNADKSFFKEKGTRILKFCDLVLENSQTMKAIVLVGNDQHNLFRYAEHEGYNFLRI